MPGRLSTQLSQRDVDTLDIIEDIFDREQVTHHLYNPSLLLSVGYPRIEKADVHRSLFHFFDATEEIQRTQQRTKLERLLNAVVSYHEGRHPQSHQWLMHGCDDLQGQYITIKGFMTLHPYYYSHWLTVIRLKDCTQRTLEPVAELLKMQVPILQKVDPILARHLERMDLPCYFAISWFITWFSHDVPHFNEVCRLFDFFLATHPLMPLYIGAVGMHAARSELLEAQEMSELHKSLVNLHVLRYLTVEEVIFEAISMYHKHPPRRVIRDLPFRLVYCVTPFAALENDLWTVPSKPPVYQFRRPHKWLIHTVVGGMLGGNGLTSTSVKLVSMAGTTAFMQTPLHDLGCCFLGVGICAVAVVALKLLETDFDPVHKSLWDGLFHS